VIDLRGRDIAKKVSELLQIRQIAPFRVKRQVPFVLKVGDEIEDEFPHTDTLSYQA
jgi:hypothetical protein